MIQIIYEKDIFTKAGIYLKKSIEEIFEKKDHVVLALPGGRSIISILDSMKNQSIDWEKIHVFMVDERMVPIDSDDSNYRLINKSLKDIIPKKNLHPFIFEKKDPLLSYENELKNFGGKYDIIVLSSGEDGHIAALYPNHQSIFDESEYFISMKDSPKLPKERMSSSKKLILKSKYAFLFFVGESKKEALDNFSDKNKKYFDSPAKLIKKIPNSYVFTNIF